MSWTILFSTFISLRFSVLYSSLFCSCFISLACSGGRPPTVDPILSGSSMSDKISKKDIHRLQAAKIVIIGETHDHPTHHLIQAETIKWLKPKSVALEMINSNQQETLNQLFELPPHEWEKSLSWSKRGWPDFKLYRPIFEAALEVGAQLIAAHPNPETISPLKRGEDLPTSLRERLKLDHPLPSDQREALIEEIRIAHCGHAPPAVTQAMLKAQRLKDAWMSEVILSAPHPVILLVGRGHTHPQRGIPWALKQLQSTNLPIMQVLSLTPSVPTSQGSESVINLQVKPHRTDNPCERFRKQLKRLQKNMKTTPH